MFLGSAALIECWIYTGLRVFLMIKQLTNVKLKITLLAEKICAHCEFSKDCNCLKERLGVQVQNTKINLRYLVKTRR